MGILAIQVDDKIKEKFQTATPQERAQWEAAFNLWWRVYFIGEPKQKLAAVLDYFRQKSAERGLTEEELNALLKDE